MGGYPAAALRVWAGRTSNLAEVIARGDPLPSTEGPDPAAPEFVRMVAGVHEPLISVYEGRLSDVFVQELAAAA